MASRKRTSSPTPAATGQALHIGLNSVDPQHYAGWSGDLNACEQDARDMQAIAAMRGMRSTILPTAVATRTRVLQEIRKAAKALRSGDFFFLSYSGHGGQVPDVSGEEGDDKQDETWCLYDGQLIDDELYLEFAAFKRGVRILVLSDSCHSGTVARVAPPLVGSGGGGRGGPAARLMPPAVAMRTYQANKAFYDRLQRATARAASKGKAIDPDAALAHVAVSPRLGRLSARFNPSLILISGCMDNQTSLDGTRNGAFTEALLKVWRRGAFTGNYSRFHREIRAKLPDSQTPNLFTLGSVGAFLNEQPFSVARQAGRKVTPASAATFLKAAALPAPARIRGVIKAVPAAAAGAVEDPFDTAKTQAAVTGSSVFSFVTGVTPERREAILNSALFAQLHASNQVKDPRKVYDWYNAYLDVLANIGWVVQDRGFAEYVEKKGTFETHKAILNVATTLLGPGATALAVVKTTLDSLTSMDEDSPWITIFNRESQHAFTARFQVGLVEQDAGGQFFVSLMAFGLVAKAEVTQVLFFKVKKSKVKFRHFSSRVTINTEVLDSVREQLKEQIKAHAANYIRRLPAL